MDVTWPGRPLRWSSRARIGWVFSLLAGLLFGLFGVMAGQTAREQGAQESAEHLQELADRLADRLDADMAERQRDVVKLAALQEAMGLSLDAPRWRKLLEQLKTSLRHYSWIGLAAPDGTVLAATGGLLEGRNVAQRPWFQQGSERPTVGDVHEAVLLASLLPTEAGAEPPRFVDVAAPMTWQGRTVGVIGGHLSWAWAEERRREALAVVSAARQVEIVLVNRQGQQVLGPDRVRWPTGQALPTQAQAVTWADGRTYLTAVRASQGHEEYPGMGWQVVVRQPTDTAYAAANALQHRLWWLGGLGALMFGLLAWGLAGRLTAPLRRVALWARTVTPAQRGGDFSAAGGDEVAQLAASLKELIEALRDREQALSQLNAQLEARVLRRTEALARVNDDLRAFARSVSHDLQGPLSSISLVMQAELQRGAAVLPDSTRRALALVQQESERLRQLTQDLLALSQVEQADLVCQVFQPAQQVAQALDEARASSRMSRTPVALGPLPEVWADPGLLRQVWTNLLGNALKYSSKAEAPQVVVSAETTAQEWIFTVADNGAGFDMTQAGRLFQVFQRLHSPADFSGTGVGLSIVQRVVRRHGGRVWAEGEPGQGARFHFSLPRPDAAGGPHVARQAGPPAANDPRPDDVAAA